MTPRERGPQAWPWPGLSPRARCSTDVATVFARVNKRSQTCRTASRRASSGRKVVEAAAVLDRHDIGAAAARAATASGRRRRARRGGWGQTTGRADKTPDPAPARGPVVPAGGRLRPAEPACRCVLMARCRTASIAGCGSVGGAHRPSRSGRRGAGPGSPSCRCYHSARESLAGGNFRALPATTAPLWRQSNR